MGLILRFFRTAQPRIISQFCSRWHSPCHRPRYEDHKVSPDYIYVTQRDRLPTLMYRIKCISARVNAIMSLRGLHSWLGTFHVTETHVIPPCGHAYRRCLGRWCPRSRTWRPLGVDLHIHIRRTFIRSPPVNDDILSREPDMIIVPVVRIPHIVAIVKRDGKRRRFNDEFKASLLASQLAYCDGSLHTRHQFTRRVCPFLRAVALERRITCLPQVCTKRQVNVPIRAARDRLHARVDVGVADAADAVLDNVPARDAVDNVIRAVVVIGVAARTVAEDELDARGQAAQDAETGAHVLRVVQHVLRTWQGELTVGELLQKVAPLHGRLAVEYLHPPGGGGRVRGGATHAAVLAVRWVVCCQWVTMKVESERGVSWLADKGELLFEKSRAFVVDLNGNRRERTLPAACLSAKTRLYP